MAVDRIKTTVLVVEDEALIRMVTVDTLEDAGFNTIEAANADEAIAIVCDRHDIDVLFTDVNMPGKLDGMDLMRLVTENRPDISVILASGMERPAKSSLPPRTLFFEKPYSYRQIITAINTLTIT
jgi:CheY-like chemotaxis protein